MASFSNILGYVQMKKAALAPEKPDGGRRLQAVYGTGSEEDAAFTIKRLMDLEKRFHRSLCSNIPVNTLWKTNTENSVTQMLKFAYTTQQQVQAFQGQSMHIVLPVLSAIQYLPIGGENFCIQVAFVKTNPVKVSPENEPIHKVFLQTNYIVKGQEYSVNALFRMEEITNTVLETEAEKVSLREAQTVYFDYDFVQNRMRKNQTMCMQQDLTVWTPTGCITTYLKTMVKCQCREILGKFPLESHQKRLPY